MSFFNLLLISALSVFHAGPIGPVYEGSGACDSLAVEHTITADQNGKFTLSITPKGGTAPYTIFVWSENGDLLNDKGSEREFKNLSSGKYEGVVGDANKCGKKFEITIQK